MRAYKTITICLILFAVWSGYALEPDQILIIANSDIAASVRIAQYYCTKRKVPQSNILALPLGTSLNDTIARDNYEKKLAGSVKKKLSDFEFLGKIRCLLTTYGVPLKVAGRGPITARQNELVQLKKMAEQVRNKIEQLKQSGNADTSGHKRKLARLQSKIDCITGKETAASVDSELSMVLFGDYELYRWQPNNLKNEELYWDFRTLMVCRLDGPGDKMAQDLVDKAIAAEKTHLQGVAYIDSRGIADDKKRYSFGHFDQSLRDLAKLTSLRTQLAVKQERTEQLFEPGTCPCTAIYCGWYSLQEYIDAFDFVDGAIGYHISSLEAVDLRDPGSKQWCPAMLKDGITATLGAVAEPYLHSFPQPREFFGELFDGHCLVEAYYHTKPFNSWQLILIGDPLYKPF